MKRDLRTALLFLLIGVAGMTKTFAQQQFEADNLLYTIVSTDPPMVSLDGHIDGTSASDELVIPETVEYAGDEYTVVAIGDYAFADCTDMYGDIDIPGSVLSIGSHAFDNAGFDGNLILGESVTTIGSYAFANLGSTGGGLAIPNSVTVIGDHAFYQSYFDGSFTLSNSVTSIGAYAFYNLTMITANPLNLSSFPLTSIGEYAFYHCTGMTGRLTLPTALTSLGAHAFEGTGFTQLNFGSTTNSQLQSIGEYAFAECASMAGNLAFPNSLQYVGEGAFSNSKFNGNLTLRNVQTIGAYAFNGVPFNDRGLTIPTSVTEIGEGAFEGSFQGGTLTINANLTAIPASAFSSCGFTAITIPSTVTTIGNNAFSYCYSVTGELTIPSSVTTIGEYAFYGTSFTGTLTIPENMTSIGEGAFTYCNGFTTLNYNAIDCSLPEYGWVYDCEALTTLNIGENVEVIPHYAFRNCYNFTGDLVIPENIVIIGMQAFSGCNFTSIHFNAIDCESMGYNPEAGNYSMVFYNNSSLQQIVIGDNVTQIPRFAFANHCAPNCTVVLGNSVEEIKRGAFTNSSDYGGITGELVIPSSVRYIRSRAFQGCWGLTGITVMGEEPPTVGDDQGTDTFDGMNMSIPVLVPCGFEEAYTSISWGGFSNIHGMCDGTVTVAANPIEAGTVTGGGTFEAGQSCTVTATANEGYTFINWKENGTVVSSENPFTFTVLGDRNLVANFFEGSVCTLAIDLYDSYGDGYTGNYLVVSYGDLTEQLTVGSGSSASHTLLIPDGSHVGLGWIVGEYPEDCSFTISYANGNVIYHGANLNSSFSFEFDMDCEGMPTTTFNIMAIANSAEGGTVTGGGTFEVGQSCTVTATTNEGYTFVNWTKNGLVVSTDAVYTFPVTNNMTLVANFASHANIVFADENVKAICVANWDTNGDGELSYAEAAAVTNLGGVFNDNGDITSFDELQYFVNLTSIGDYAFYGCPGLISIEIPNTVTSFGNCAFDGCSALSSIEIPNSVTSIGYLAFQNCSALTSIIVRAETPPELGWDVFENFPTDIPVYVPCASLEDYQNAEGWNVLSNFIGMCPGTITATANPTEGGTISGTGLYDYGATCTLTATPNEGYGFANWMENGSVVSTEVEYSFMVDGDRELVANFASTAPIVFADETVKAICVANWDTDGDGELSYDEAAAVTDLGFVFQYNDQITSFDELQYFIGLVSIGYGAFNDCNSLTSVVIPNSVILIEEDAFLYCSGLTSIEIPNSVTIIGSWAFCVCSSLSSIVIPNSVNDIGVAAFSGCTGLTSIEIPSSVTSIGARAFQGCNGLTSMSVASGNTYYDSRDNCNAIIETATNTLILGCKNTVIPNSVTSIGGYAFRACTSLTSIEIPNSVTTIGESAFAYCDGLTSITSLSSVPPTLGDYAFADVNTDIPVYVPCDNAEDYISANWGGFSNIIGWCGGTIAVSVNPTGAGTVTGGGTYEAGQSCTVTATPNEGFAFANWTKNGLVVSTDASYTFSVIGDMTLEANFIIDGNIVFSDTNVKAICVSNWDTNGDGELSYVEAAAVTNLGEVFQNNGQITSFDELQYFIGLASIKENAFSNCTGLTSTEIPNSVTSIENYAFGGCTGLTSIEIPNSVTYIGNGAFRYCDGLEQMTVEMGNTVYDSRDNCNAIIETASNTLIAGCRNTVIPNSVTSIGDYAFSQCYGLTSIEIPNSVTSIGEGAFESCTGLTSIEIPNSVTSISSFAFYYCTGLTSVVIPNSVTYIGNGAFRYCDGLEQMTVEMGNTVYDSRDNCNAIIETASNTLIAGCRNTVIPNSVTSIGDYAFSQCYGLTSIEIPNSVTSIGEGAFESCTSLTSIEIPNSVTSIGYAAFYYCYGLTSMTVHAEMPPTLGEYAFEGLNTDIPVYVPCGYEEAYSSINWGGFSNFVGMCAYEITATAEPTEGGSVSLSATIILTAGDVWGDGSGYQMLLDADATAYGNEIPYEDPYTDSNYDAFEYIIPTNADCNTYTNNIVINNSISIEIPAGTYDWCITNPEPGYKMWIAASYGNVGGRQDDYVFEAGKIYEFVPSMYDYGGDGVDVTITPKVYTYGQTCTVIATPKEGYTFINWTENGTEVSTDAAYSFMVTGNRNLVANFGLQFAVSGYGIGEGKWKFIASPIVEDTEPTAVTNMISASPYDLYRFNQSAELEWENYKTEGEHYHFTLENGTGYLYANAEDVHLVFKGTFNEEETQEVSLVYDEGKSFAGWNLVGNPFPVQAYANRSYYTMNDEGTGIEPNTVSSATAIPACTGIMVKAETTGESVTFSKTAPSAAANNGALQIAVAQANTRGLSVQDKAIVSFNAGDELGKFYFGESNAKLYIPQNGKDYAVAVIASDSEAIQKEVPIHFKATRNGTYTISVDLLNAECGYLHLIDNMTGADIDLLQTNEYTFSSKPSDYASRFRLVFSTICEDANGDNETFAFIDAGGNIVINGEGSLQIVDVTGRVIVSVGGHTRCVPTAGIPAGVYVLRLINGDNVRTQKMVITKD